MNTDASELTDDEMYEQHRWGRVMDRHSMSMVTFSPSWWSNIMQTVSALGIVAVLGLILSMKSDVNYLMRGVPYETKVDYDKDADRMRQQIERLEQELHRAFPGR